MSQKVDKLTIPSWQRAQSATPASPAQQRQAEPTPEPGTEEFAEHQPAAEGVSLLEQASKFLKDPSIRDAPRDRKAAFLETKGLSKDEVEKLLGAELEQDTSSKLLKEGEEAWSKVSSIWEFTTPLCITTESLFCTFERDFSGDLPPVLKIDNRLHIELRDRLLTLYRLLPPPTPNHSPATFHRLSPIPNSSHKPRNHHLSSLPVIF
jgi:hypothetical protein